MRIEQLAPLVIKSISLQINFCVLFSRITGNINRVAMKLWSGKAAVFNFLATLWHLYIPIITAPPHLCVINFCASVYTAYAI